MPSNTANWVEAAPNDNDQQPVPPQQVPEEEVGFREEREHQRNDTERQRNPSQRMDFADDAVEAVGHQFPFLGCGDVLQNVLDVHWIGQAHSVPPPVHPTEFTNASPSDLTCL